MEFSQNFHALIQFVHLSKVRNHAEQLKGTITSHFVISALLAAHQFDLGLPDLCCFRENITELSSELWQLPCE
ncbi:hypothetical protein T11_167 [Trichinella zimbabwensis]|uniref:Uncharacterized protein n=1 Tax=Trichinella zimbabwensis TaxID=268475 RepID=A0A0V1HN58_9BILA|nr:hypothetical protein T11_167 [Trichinella zimbabwensis]